MTTDENETHLAMWYKFFDSGLIQQLTSFCKYKIKVPVVTYFSRCVLKNLKGAPEKCICE